MSEPTLAYDKNKTTINCYNKKASDFSARFLSLDTRGLCQRFLSLLPEKAHILDIDCGPGRDTKYFLDHGHQVTAFDAAEEFVKLARQHTGHPILHMTFEDMTFQEEFDGIWSMASLLHLSPQALLEVIEKNLIPALKSQRILYLCFKYGEGENISPDGRYFTDCSEESLQSLLDQFEALSIIDIWASEDSAPDRKGRLWINGLVQKDKL